MRYVVVVEPEAEEDLRGISDLRTRRAIFRKLSSLEDHPALRGKALGGDLSGYFSIRCAGQRYRAVYSIDVSSACVNVHAVGLRRAGDKKDVYEVADRRLN